MSSIAIVSWEKNKSGFFGHTLSFVISVPLRPNQTYGEGNCHELQNILGQYSVEVKVLYLVQVWTALHCTAD